MPRSARYAFALLVLLTPLASGCGPSAASRLIGKWEYDASKSIDDAIAPDNQPGAAFMAGLAKEFSKGIKIEVEFRSGGEMSTSYTTPFAKVEVRKTGTWKVTKTTGNEVTLSGQLEGETAEKETKIKFIDNDTVEMVPPAGNQHQPATFRRVKSK